MIVTFSLNIKLLKGNETPGQSLTPPTGNIWKMLKKWADPSGDRGDEIDAKTLYPDRFQYSQFQLQTPYSGFDETSWFLYCRSYQERGELKRAYVTKNR